jgi:hypothetical protein
VFSSIGLYRKGDVGSLNAFLFCFICFFLSELRISGAFSSEWPFDLDLDEENE